MCSKIWIVKIIPDRIALILIPVVIVFLIIAGCIGSGNSTNLSSPQNISKSTIIHTPCLTSENAKPYIHVNRIGIHYPGDIFEINGTTNFCADTKMFLYLRQQIPLETAPKPGLTYNYSNFELSMTSGNVSIQKGNDGINNWSYSANLSEFNRGIYNVNVWNYDTNIREYSNQTVVGYIAFEIKPVRNNSRT